MISALFQKSVKLRANDSKQLWRIQQLRIQLCRIQLWRAVTHKQPVDYSV